MFINMANLFQIIFVLIYVLQNIVGVTYILHPQHPPPPPYNFNDPLGVENEVDIIDIISRYFSEIFLPCNNYVVIAFCLVYCILA